MKYWLKFPDIQEILAAYLLWSYVLISSSTELRNCIITTSINNYFEKQNTKMHVAAETFCSDGCRFLRKVKVAIPLILLLCDLSRTVRMVEWIEQSVEVKRYLKLYYCYVSYYYSVFRVPSVNLNKR